MNYKKVIEDFNNGTIDPKKWQVVMDNDDGYWSYLGVHLDDDSVEKLQEKMSDTYGDPKGYNDIVDVLEGAGVNADWC